jgi:hypothetical protein
MAPNFITAGAAGALARTLERLSLERNRSSDRNSLRRKTVVALRLAVRRIVLGALALLALCSPVRAQNAYCDQLRAQIAAASNNSGVARYRAAAAKQQKEIDRTVAYGHSIGCDRRQFLFFGEAPPAQCGAVNARIAQMQGNLATLTRGSEDGQRQALIARYDSQCRQRVAARPRNFLEDLFGGGALEEDPGQMREAPVHPSDEEGGRGQGGSMAICVRACDGGFFPVSYSARRANLSELADLCRAQCPNAEVALYTRSPWRDIETALSVDGEPYSEHPNALKFTKSVDPTCSCRPPGQSWVEALAEAERLLAEKHRDDLVVSPEKAEELSRPVAARAVKGAPAPSDAWPPATPQKSEARETVREIVGPDGVKKRVRVVAPTL